MTLIPNDDKMKPIVILKAGTMSKNDIRALRANGLCVVESQEPAAIRFMEPAPQGYDVQEWAAIELARVLLRDGTVGSCKHRQAIGSMYADILLQGDPLRRVPQIENTK